MKSTASTETAAAAEHTMPHACTAEPGRDWLRAIPGVECLGVILVQLVGAGVDDSVLGQTVLRPAESQTER